MEINYIVIHELIKEQHKDIQPSHIRPDVLNPKNEIVEKLIAELSTLYGKRQNTAHYGVFKQSEGRGIFPDPLERYSKTTHPDKATFHSLTKIGMESLYDHAKLITSASGGYILFADYNTSQGRFFLVAMIKQKSGITLSDELKPEELTQLDLSRLYQAARINFNKLAEFHAADEEGKQEINYLSFISPRIGQTTAGYFITAFGCAKGTASVQATRNLIKESFTFFKEKEELKANKLKFRSALTAHLKEKVDKKESVKLHEIEELARKHMPIMEEGKADSYVEELISRLNSEEVGVPNEFPANSREIMKNTHISHREENWELKFDKTALGDTEDAQIYFDKKNEKITINDIPQRMIDMVLEELKLRRGNNDQ